MLLHQQPRANALPRASGMCTHALSRLREGVQCAGGARNVGVTHDS